MLEMIEIGIENAKAFRMAGKITKSNVSLVLSDAKAKIECHGNIVIYEEIESFKGIEIAAIVEEFKYLFEVGISNIKKAALVTDKKWLEKIVKIEDKIFKKIEMKFFSIDDKELAVGMFLGYWFIKKAMWAGKSSIKGYATSLKKFYSFMHEKGLIDKEGLTDLKQTIKEDMPEWLATLDRYDDPSVEDVW